MSARLEKVWRTVNHHRLKKTFLELLQIYSPSGKEEDVQIYLEEILTAAGFSVERQEVDDDRYNLRVTMGSGEPWLYMVGHVDTVPAWDLDTFGPKEEDGVILGLGSADMKGGCAAMVETWLALAEALEPAERPSVGLLLVVGEEENGDGSATFLQTCRPPWVVIGEPTSLAAKFAHYGYLEAGFVTRGLRSHSSLPELGHNAVESMLRVLLLLGSDPLFDRAKSEIVYSIREMKSARAGFVVPDRCETWIDLHLPPDNDPTA
ncbi:MAG: M20 family metallopeptidase, partial [Desulfobulbaceae bacterium]|nr:M20 family metallopeptidase [Desulfobulbaceae bacterium]